VWRVIRTGREGSDRLKNLLIYIVEDQSADLDPVRRMLELQIDNSLDLGWSPDDILLCTSFDFAFRGVRATKVEPGRRPRTARATSFHKTECILRVFEHIAEHEVVWYHDADAFQLVPFDGCPLGRDLAFCLYSTRERLLVQGGSLFFTSRARPIFDYVLDQLANHRCRKDEFALTDAIARREFLDQFQILDYSYNLGGTDFELRYQLADQPIKVAHFHPDRAGHLTRFVHGQNGLAVRPLDDRFVGLLQRHGFIRDGVADEPERREISKRPLSRRSTGTLAKWFRRLTAH
jgi:hypothetical protein